MKKNPFIRIAVLGAISVVFAYVIFVNFSNTKEAATLRVSRVFQDTLLVNTNFDLPTPITRFVVQDEQMFGYWWKSGNLLAINTNGMVVDTIAQKGVGPEEIGRLTGLAIEDSLLVVYDGQDFSVKSFNVETGESLDYKSSAVSLQEGGYLGNGIHLFVVDSSNEYRFRTFDNTISQIAQPSVLQDYSYTAMSFDGDVVSIPGNAAYFACYSANHFFGYTPDGRLKFASKTIDNTEPPKIIVTQTPDGVQLGYDRNRDFPNHAFGANNQYFVVLSNLANKRAPKNQVLDFYSAEDGKYSKSVVMPYQDGDYPESIFLTESNIWVAYPTKCYIYKMQSL